MVWRGRGEHNISMNANTVARLSLLRTGDQLGVPLAHPRSAFFVFKITTMKPSIICRRDFFLSLGFCTPACVAMEKNAISFGVDWGRPVTHSTNIGSGASRVADY
eukprot:GEMP01126279.1.p1 GENE.GEMP01126279.1~~GEMP01126279.1.p1  ORF type:complete len:105 (+),score=6.22 GEMP01126279.1:76-390(+)